MDGGVWCVVWPLWEVILFTTRTRPVPPPLPRRSFPDWGRSFQTAIIAVVVINQILGPILFKIAVSALASMRQHD